MFEMEPIGTIIVRVVFDKGENMTTDRGYWVEYEYPNTGARGRARIMGITGQRSLGSDIEARDVLKHIYNSLLPLSLGQSVKKMG
jgi:hypothetical protein